MPELKKSGLLIFLRPLASGILSFFIGGILAAMLVLWLDTFLLETILAGVVGGFLLGLLSGNVRDVLKFTLAGLVALPTGFWGGFGLAAGVFSVPVIHGLFGNPHIPDIIGIILMGILTGALFAAALYGRRAIPYFSLAGGLGSLPFGILVAAMNSDSRIRTSLEVYFRIFGSIDLNLLAIITGLGCGLGLGLGLYQMFREEKNVQTD